MLRVILVVVVVGVSREAMHRYGSSDESGRKKNGTNLLVRKKRGNRSKIRRNELKD